MRQGVAATNLFDMAGRTALVTGGGTGLGKHFAMTLAEAGANVILAARRLAPLQQTVAAIQSRGGSAACITLDLTDERSIDDVFASDMLRDVDVVVNNAGTAVGGGLLDLTTAEWDQVMDVNLKGAWLVARRAVRQMIARKHPGSIVNVASVLANSVQKGTANYPAAKAALTHLTRSMAIEWAKYSIRVNAIAPGYFLTDLSAAYLETDKAKAMTKLLPMRRLGDPTELGGALLLLASNASSYMTGTVVSVDGGLSVPTI